MTAAEAIVWLAAARVAMPEAASGLVSAQLDLFDRGEAARAVEAAGVSPGAIAAAVSGAWSAVAADPEAAEVPEGEAALWTNAAQRRAWLHHDAEMDALLALLA